MTAIDETIRGTASSLGVLGADGKLIPLDSFMIIDLVMALETALDVRVPVQRLTPDNFVSLESIAELFKQYGEPTR